MASKLFWWLMSLKILKQNVNGGLIKVFDENSTSGSLLNFTELIEQHGYMSEEHTVNTEDGYVLTLFRITKGKNCHLRKPPVLLIHGLLGSSDCWIDSGPDAGLGYIIADECYDLWLGNVRGNHYSRKHLRLNPDKDPEYWQFSPHEMGIYDIPAIINYVLYNTKADKLNYIGYSQSGTLFLIMCSERPDFCNKIRLAVLLHPASAMKNTKSKLFILSARIYQFIEPYLKEALDFEVLPQEGTLQKFSKNLCQNYYTADTFCRSFLNVLDSFHPGSINASTIRTLTHHFPAGTSVKTMAWFSQALDVDVFRKFDYGPETNFNIYGTVQTPLYNVSTIDIPVVIVHGKNDYLVSPQDVRKLRDQLPNVLELFYVEDPLWNHVDVLYSQHTKKKIFPKINEYLFQFSEQNTDFERKLVTASRP